MDSTPKDVLSRIDEEVQRLQERIGALKEVKKDIGGKVKTSLRDQSLTEVMHALDAEGRVELAWLLLGAVDAEQYPTDPKTWGTDEARAALVGLADDASLSVEWRITHAATGEALGIRTGGVGSIASAGHLDSNRSGVTVESVARRAVTRRHRRTPEPAA